MTPTNAEIADHLDAMHDVLLARGRAKGTFGKRSGGPVCLMGASLVLYDPKRWATEGVAALHLAAFWALRLRLGEAPTGWNDLPSTTDDMAFDLLRQTAKELRDADS